MLRGGREMVRATIVVLLVSLGLGPRTQAEPVAQPVDSEILAAFAKALRRWHISGRPLDAGVSRQCFQNFLDSLDPRRAFFEQADVDRLAMQSDRIGEMVSKGDARFAYETCKVFLRRRDERLRDLGGQSRGTGWPASATRSDRRCGEDRRGSPRSAACPAFVRW